MKKQEEEQKNKKTMKDQFIEKKDSFEGMLSALDGSSQDASVGLFDDDDEGSLYMLKGGYRVPGMEDNEIFLDAAQMLLLFGWISSRVADIAARLQSHNTTVLRQYYGLKEEK